MSNSQHKYNNAPEIKLNEYMLSELPQVLKNKYVGYCFNIYGSAGAWKVLKSKHFTFIIQNKITSQILQTTTTQTAF